MVLTFKSADKTLRCDNSNDSHQAVLSCDTDYAVSEYEVVLMFKSVNDHSNESY